MRPQDVHAKEEGSPEKDISEQDNSKKIVPQGVRNSGISYYCGSLIKSMNRRI